MRLGSAIVYGLVLALGGACGKPPPTTAEARAKAQQIWTDRCVTCHGEHGRGDGPGSRILPVKPRNFGDGQWQRDTDDERIAKVIVEGGRAVGLDSNMAANPDLRDQPEVTAALVEIIRGL